MKKEYQPSEKKITIIGGGILGLLKAYYAFKEAQGKNETLRITIYKKNALLEETTAMKIAPSLTSDETQAVIPFASLMKNIEKPFDEPGGMGVKDVEGIMSSEAARRFLDQAKAELIVKLSAVGHQLLNPLCTN